MSQYGQQPGYPQQPYGNQPFPGGQPGFQPPMGNQSPAYGQVSPPVRLSKGDVYSFGPTTQFSAVLRWDGRGVDLAKVASLPPGYAAPQQPYGNQPFQGHQPMGQPGYPQQPQAQYQNPHQHSQPYGHQAPGGSASADDLDLVIFVVDTSTGKVLSDSAFVFYNNRLFLLPGKPAVVQLDGDNRTGNGADDEIGRLNVADLPPQYKLRIGASIYDLTGTKTFGTIKNAEICMVGPHGVLAEYALGKNVKTMAAVIFGDVLFDPNRGWHFCANPQPYANLHDMARQHGVNV